jgi:GNAT superfamily N-acetyltransferase
MGCVLASKGTALAAASNFRLIHRRLAVEPIIVRSFHRGDRDQLAALMNGHARAVVPGVSMSVNAVMSQLEREPNEFIVDPWVQERATLVAELRSRIVGAAHLLRYSSGDQVGEDYRGAGEIRWLLFWPESSNTRFWPDPAPAGDALMAACSKQFAVWGVARRYANGTLAVPGVYGVPEPWPHVRALYERTGFTHTGDVEAIFVVDCDALTRFADPPIDKLDLRRSVGINGTRLSATLEGQVVGYIEVDVLDDTSRLSHRVVWSDIGNLYVPESHRRRGIARWLIGGAGRWLRMSGVDYLIGYADPEDAVGMGLLTAMGFRELTRTARGWTADGRVKPATA